MAKNNSPKKGQILLITLLVLLILGIIVVGIVVFTNRDIEQSTTNQKYEEINNSADTRLKTIVSQFGTYSVPLSSIPGSFPECVEVLANVEYRCGFSDTTTGNLDLTNVVEVENKKEITDFEIRKDESLEINLNGYNRRVNLVWDKASAIDFTIILRDATSNYTVVKDVFDLADIYTSLINDDPYADPSNIHRLSFSVFDASKSSTSVTIDIAASIPAGLTPVSMRITPRMNTTYGSILLDVTASDNSTFPFQMREFISTSYDPEDNSSPVVKLTTKIPLHPQTDAMFDYALLTEGAIALD